LSCVVAVVSVAGCVLFELRGCCCFCCWLHVV
jgi:hypothetical protein